MKKILYVSNVGFPNTAPGIRIFRIGTLLEHCNCEVHYICDRFVSITEQKYKEKIIPASGSLNENEVHFLMGKKIYSFMPECRPKKTNAITGIFQLFSAQKILKRIISYSQKEEPAAIFLYDGSYALTKRLIPYCKKHGIRLFADVTEWYENDKSKNFIGKMVAKLTDKRITQLDHKLDGIIAISHYFEDFYKSKGVRCVRIPPLMDMEEGLSITRSSEELVRFVYAGSPGGKDILLPFVQAIQEFNREGVRARLDVIGIGPDYFQSTSEELEKQGIFAHGRLPHDATLQLVKASDFGILFRHPLRYAKAGFSTKLSECMSVGVPMICNRIGGSDLVITHMENGILTDTAEVQELYELLVTLTSLSSDEILALKKNAYTYALQHFRRDNYTNEIQKLLTMEEEF